MRGIAALAVVAVSMPSCGSSNHNAHIVAACRTTVAHSLATPVTGRIYAFGGPKVEVQIDNAGKLSEGQATLAASDYPGWMALRTHFFTPPSYTGAFSAVVHGIQGSGVAGIGAAPPGSAINEPPGPTEESSHGWRAWPAYTWLRDPGCYVFTISGRGFVEHVTIAALSP